MRHRGLNTDDMSELPLRENEARNGGGGGFLMGYFRRFVNSVKAVFKQNISAPALAKSFAFGVTGGLFPIPGTTLLICMVFIWGFSLNPLATQLANVLMTVPELLLLIPFIRVGEFIYQSDPIPLSTEALKTNFGNDWSGTLLSISGRFVHAITAWAVFTAVVTPLLYFIFLPILKRFVKK